MAEVPAGKKVNGFTEELEEAAPLLLAPSPTDQRKLAAEQDDEPLIDKVRERVETDTARNVDGAFVQDNETVNNDITSKPEVQHVDVPPTNTRLVEEGWPVADIEYPEVPTSVVSPNATPQAPTDSQDETTTQKPDDALLPNGSSRPPSQKTEEGPES